MLPVATWAAGAVGTRNGPIRRTTRARRVCAKDSRAIHTSQRALTRGWIRSSGFSAGTIALEPVPHNRKQDQSRVAGSCMEAVPVLTSTAAERSAQDGRQRWNQDDERKPVK